MNLTIDDLKLNKLLIDEAFTPAMKDIIIFFFFMKLFNCCTNFSRSLGFTHTTSYLYLPKLISLKFL